MCCVLATVATVACCMSESVWQCLGRDVNECAQLNCKWRARGSGKSEGVGSG